MVSYRKNWTLSLLVSFSGRQPSVFIYHYATFERSPAQYNETIGPKQKKCISPQRFCSPGMCGRPQIGGTVKWPLSSASRTEGLTMLVFSVVEGFRPGSCTVSRSQTTPPLITEKKVRFLSNII